MGLQVRVRHALGERLTDLPARTVDHPVVVGRSAAADVQVPSVSVALKHCALFVHDGVWAIQDLGGTSGTFVNGKKVAGPTPLNIGDVVTVGAESGAPKLEIDPAGTAEGRTGRARAAGPAAPPPAGAGATAAGAAYSYASAPAAPVVPSAPVAPYAGYPQAGGYGPMVPPVGGYSSPATYATPAVGPPPGPAYYAAAPAPQADAQGAWSEAGASANPDHVQWDTPAEGEVTPYYPSYRRRGKKQGGGAGTIIGVLLVAGIAGGGAWFILKQREKPPTVAAAKTQPATRPAPVVAAAPVDVPPGAYDPTPTVNSKAFGSPGGKPMPLPGPGGTAQSPATAPAATPPVAVSPPGPTTAPAIAMAPRGPTSPAPQDPPKASPDPATTEDPGPEPAVAAEGSWEQMVELDIVAPDPAVAILKFEDYRRNHPGKQDQKIDEFIEKKLDQIWWDRVNQLFKKRDQLTAGMSKIKREIVDETNPEEKKKQLDSYYEQEKELKRTTSTLREEMGYASDQPPDLSDNSKLEAARAKRDKTKFEGWKKRTHGYIKRTNGKLEWGGGK